MQKRNGWLWLIAFASAGAYLLLSGWRNVVGFPLDDAWIHQVYARNLGTHFEFAFFAGQPSAGSTSPLWTILLSLGYLLHIDFRVWAYLLGVVLFALNAMLISRIITFYILRFSSFTYLASRVAFLSALYILLEWHLIWSAVSGMEILLFIFISLVLVERFFTRAQPWWLGVIAGLLTLTRPEGVVLSALVFLGSLLQTLKPQKPVLSEAKEHEERKEILKKTLGVLSVFAVRFGLGFALVFLPYLAFNISISGAIFPNTFYAKAAEYAELFSRAPFIVRWLELLWTPFVGAQILLLPGLLYIVGMLVKKREWLALLPVAWILLLPALYALRLPVTYQHGRYEMPIIPFIVIYGVWGTLALFERLQSWVIRAAWGISIAAVLVVFWLLGAAQYSTDVAVIDCEMVQTARWIAANAPADAVIAAHDIGALGYFYNRPFIDLAGLVSPEVIPFIRDESRLRDYLFARNATFVVVFPNWYSTLTNDPRLVSAFQTDCTVTRNAGEKNMIVYKIK